MRPTNAPYKKLLFPPACHTGRCFLAAWIGLFLLGMNACSKTSNEPPSHFNETPQGSRVSYRVGFHPAHCWLESFGKVHAGNTAEEKILVAHIHESLEKAQLKPGRKIEFKADRFAETRFEGTIISTQEARNSSGISASIRVTAGQENFKPDDLMLIHILEGEKLTLAVPKTSLLFKDGRFYVYLLAEGRTRLKEVQPLFAGSDYPLFSVSDHLVAIAGLKEGDEVVLEAIGEESE